MLVSLEINWFKKTEYESALSNGVQKRQHEGGFAEQFTKRRGRIQGSTSHGHGHRVVVVWVKCWRLRGWVQRGGEAAKPNSGANGGGNPFSVLGASSIGDDGGPPRRALSVQHLHCHVPRRRHRLQFYCKSFHSFRRLLIGLFLLFLFLLFTTNFFHVYFASNFGLGGWKKWIRFIHFPTNSMGVLYWMSGNQIQLLFFTNNFTRLNFIDFNIYG